MSLGFQGFRVSGFQGFRVSEFQSFRVQGFRVSGFQGFRVSEFQSFRVQGFRVYSRSFLFFEVFVIASHFRVSLPASMRFPSP
jgi:hypothetical protein